MPGTLYVCSWGSSLLCSGMIQKPSPEWLNGRLLLHTFAPHLPRMYLVPEHILTMYLLSQPLLLQKNLWKFSESREETLGY